MLATTFQAAASPAFFLLWSTEAHHTQENKEKDKAEKVKREFRERKLWGLIIGGHLCEIKQDRLFFFCLCHQVWSQSQTHLSTFLILSSSTQAIVEFGGGLIPQLLL